MHITTLSSFLVAVTSAMGAALPPTGPTANLTTTHFSNEPLESRPLNLTQSLLVAEAVAPAATPSPQPNSAGGKNRLVARVGKDYKPDDPLPIQKLPPCHQECFRRNHNNGWPRMGDVLEMTVNQFCHERWLQVGNWLIDHILDCVNEICTDCGDECGEASTKWMQDTCGFLP